MWHGVGAAGKGPEGGHIGKVSVVVAAHIQIEGVAVYDALRRLQRRDGDMQAGGKVVGAAVGEIAHLWTLRQLHQAGHHLVEGAVAAGADHQIVCSAQLCRRTGGVSTALGEEYLHQIARLGKAGHRIKQRCKGLGAPRTWIDDKQKLFIHTGSPLLHTVLGFVFPQKTA